MNGKEGLYMLVTAAVFAAGVGLAYHERQQDEQRTPCGSSEYFERGGYEVTIDNFDDNCDGVIDRREFRTEFRRE